MGIFIFLEIRKKLIIGYLFNGLLLVSLDMIFVFVFGDGRGDWGCYIFIVFFYLNCLM